MSFTIPRQKNSEMILYIWKIINLPYISFDNLLYKISFELMLYSPNKAIEFINDAISNNLIILDDNKNLKLSEKLNKEFQRWQNDRKTEILRNMDNNAKKIKLKYKFEQNIKDRFNILLKGFTDKSTLNRAVGISESAFDLKIIDLKKGLLEGTVSGSKEEPYFIKINLNDKVLTHNCHDFESRKSKEKKFCKHLIRLFLLLKEKDQELATSFLKQITNNIEKWNFSN